MKNSMRLMMLIVAISSFVMATAQCGGKNICSPNLDKYTLLKSYQIDIPARVNKMEKPTQKEFPVILSKGVRYRITSCPNTIASEGDMIMGLHLGTKLISTNYNANGKNYKAFEFICNKTGVYYLKVHFHDGLKGCGSASLSMAK